MTYSNSDILAAVLNRFLQPVVMQFAQSKMGSLPFVQMAENKIRSWGIVGQGWSLASELGPLIEPLSGQLIEPMIKGYLSKVPDESLPAMAHEIVDTALAQGGLNLLDGRLQIDVNDLQELKKLLNYNLPYNPGDRYHVKTTQDEPGTAADQPQVG